MVENKVEIFSAITVSKPGYDGRIDECLPPAYDSGLNPTHYASMTYLSASNEWYTDRRFTSKEDAHDHTPEHGNLEACASQEWSKCVVEDTEEC